MGSILSLVETIQCKKIQMHFPQKQKTFCQFFFCLFQIYIKILTFLKKDDPHSLCISKNYPLRGPLYREHGKRAELLIQSKRQHLYHIH